MSRDILENLLQERLSEMSVNPPTGLWEKLESGLAAAGAIGAGIGAGAAAAEGAASGVSAAVGQGGASAATASATTATTSALGGGGLSGAAIGGIAAGVAATAAIVGVVLYDGETSTPSEATSAPIVENIIEEEVAEALEELEFEITPGRYMAVAVPAPAADPVPIEEKPAVAQAPVEPFKIEPSKTIRREVGQPALVEPIERKPVSLSLFAANTGVKFGGDKRSGGGSSFSVTEILEGPMGSVGIGGYEVPVSEIKHHLPLSFGLNLDFRITDRLWISSGAFYTYLKSDARSISNGIKYDFEQKLHYIGVPLWLKYDLLDNENFRLYTGAGATFEKLVDSKQTLSFNHPASVFGVKKIEKGLSNKGIQTSVGLNLGAQWNLSPTVGLYFEPGVSYFIENKDQPISYRTENRFNFNLKLGLSIKLTK